jgi:DNA (cytosine-5)-methyltransferase 1
VTLTYLSVCSGIEAASVAWHTLGWRPVAFSEIDPFACAMLAARFPLVPNLGDMERYREWPIEPGAIDVLVAGTPCQSFSVAGLRKGLSDPRGNLALVFLGLVDRFRPRYIVWENVPGVLSADGGRAFGAFIGALAELGYGWSYRVLDAQYTRVDSHPRAVPQRRRRVFVVGCAGGDAQRAASILLELEGVRGNPPTRRASWQSPPRRAAGGARDGGIADVSPTVVAKWSKGTGGPAGDEAQNLVPTVSSTLGRRRTRSHTELDGHGAHIVQPLPFDTTQITSRANRSSPQPGDPCHPLARGAHAPAVALPAFDWPVDVADPVTANEGATYSHEGSHNFRMHNVVPAQVIGFQSNLGSRGGDVFDGVSPTMRIGTQSEKGGGNPPAVASSMAVRRLTPRECERLQGFPDDWTAITYRGKPASDGPRYKALGNSMAVNVMRWIGLRIAAVEGGTHEVR